MKKFVLDLVEGTDLDGKHMALVFRQELRTRISKAIKRYTKDFENNGYIECVDGRMQKTVVFDKLWKGYQSRSGNREEYSSSDSGNSTIMVGLLKTSDPTTGISASNGTLFSGKSLNQKPLSAVMNKERPPRGQKCKRNTLSQPGPGHAKNRKQTVSVPRSKVFPASPSAAIAKSTLPNLSTHIMAMSQNDANVASHNAANGTPTPVEYTSRRMSVAPMMSSYHDPSRPQEKTIPLGSPIVRHKLSLFIKTPKGWDFTEAISSAQMHASNILQFFTWYSYLANLPSSSLKTLTFLSFFSHGEKFILRKDDQPHIWEKIKNRLDIMARLAKEGEPLKSEFDVWIGFELEDKEDKTGYNGR